MVVFDCVEEILLVGLEEVGVVFVSLDCLVGKGDVDVVEFCGGDVVEGGFCYEIGVVGF